MRMEIADDLRPAAIARGAVRGDEGCGINLEVMCRIGRDVGCGGDCFDACFGAQKEAAGFVRRGAVRGGEHRTIGGLA
ncbi:MAG: hypothetical protein RIS85_424 [Pseudomonadota bacterium]